MRRRGSDLSGISSVSAPGRAMSYFFAPDLEKGRIARPPFNPYATADSLEAHSWLPSGGPRAWCLGKRGASQKSVGRYTGSQDLAIGQYALYRMRLIMAGDLTGDWGGFG